MNGIMRKKLREIQQTSPLSGWIRLSTDGAAKVEVGVAGCGGILRNDNGVWMASFSKHGDCMKEAWLIILGITRL
jgi:hypothetical protein